MKWKIIFVLVLLLLLAGCGRKKVPDLQSFEGVTVATLQTPFSLMDETSLSETALALPGSEETPYPTALEPTQAAGDGLGLNPTAAQGNLNPYLINTPLPTNQFTLTPPPTQGSSVWDGNWNIWYQNSSGAYLFSVMNIQVSEAQFSGTATINVVDYTFKGDFNTEGTEAAGKWKTVQVEGSFWWQMISDNTFVGSRENRFGFCGDRISANRPGSCRKMPPN